MPRLRSLQARLPKRCKLNMRSPFFRDIFRPWLRRAGAGLFLPALAVVCWGELIPHPPSLPGPWEWDKADHLTAYFGLGLFAVLGWGRRGTYVWLWLGVTAIGGCLEVVQSFIGRDAEWGDILANSTGAAVAVGLGAAYLSIPRSPR